MVDTYQCDVRHSERVTVHRFRVQRSGLRTKKALNIRFCDVVYPAVKPEDFRSCVVKDSR
jgi:hypothetical protein